jgi:hypothetical protein
MSAASSVAISGLISAEFPDTDGLISDASAGLISELRDGLISEAMEGLIEAVRTSEVLVDAASTLLPSPTDEREKP